MGKYFNPNRCISGIIYIFTFDLEIFTSKNWKKKYWSTRKLYIWAKILSHIIVGLLQFMFMYVFFSKVHPACHNIANGIKPGSNSKTTDKHAVDAQKLYVGA